MGHKEGHKFIQEVISSPKFRKGELTKKAHAHGESTALDFAHKVLGNPKAYSMQTRRQSQFLVNIQKQDHLKKR